MGYNTFMSLPKLLSNRKHIVLSHRNIKLPDEVLLFHNKESVLDYAKKHNEDIFIIGGASIYKEFLNFCDKMILTEIDSTCNEADAYFPSFNEIDWNKTILKEGEYKSLKYKHVIYKRNL